MPPEILLTPVLANRIILQTTGWATIEGASSGHLNAHRHAKDIFKIMASERAVDDQYQSLTKEDWFLLLCCFVVLYAH